MRWMMFESYCCVYVYFHRTCTGMKYVRRGSTEEERKKEFYIFYDSIILILQFFSLHLFPFLLKLVVVPSQIFKITVVDVPLPWQL
jgi:hypothetical protein